MATFTPTTITTTIPSTTPFSEYRNKIQGSLDELETGVNASLTELYDVTAIEAGTSYTQAYLDDSRANLIVRDSDIINSQHPYSGNTQFNELDKNFVFEESVDFLASVADTNRYVKQGDVVVDTYTDVAYDAVKGGVVTSMIDYVPEAAVQDQLTYGLATQVDVASGDYVVVDRMELVVNGTFDVDTTGWADVGFGVSSYDTTIFPNGGLKLTNSGGTNGSTSQVFTTTVGEYYVFTCSAKDGNGNAYIEVRETDSAGAQKEFLDASGDLVLHFTATTSSTYIALRNVDADLTYVYYDNISVTQVDEVYKNTTASTILAGADIPTSFTNHDHLPISNQVMALHTMDSATKAYEGITKHILMVDAYAGESNKSLMVKNGFSEVSEGLYSKGTKIYTCVGYFQTLNKGAYHPTFNSSGTTRTTNYIYSSYKYWYNTDKVATMANMFMLSTVDSNSWKLSNSGYIGAPVVSGRPDGKFYDIIYKDQFIDLREYSFKADKLTLDRMVKDKEFNGVEGAVFTKDIPQQNNDNASFANAVYVPDTSQYYIGEYIAATNVTKSTVKRGYIASISTDFYIVLENTNNTVSVTYPNGDINIGDVVVVSSLINNNSTGTQLSTDLIGDPAQYVIGDATYTVPTTVSITDMPIGTLVWDEPTGIMYKSILGTEDIDANGVPVPAFTDTASWSVVQKGYPQMMLDRLAENKGLFGINPLLVGELGEDYIPENGNTWWKYTNKVVDELGMKTSSDNGVTWSESTSDYIDLILNGNNVGLSGLIGIVQYTSQNLPLQIQDPLPITVNGVKEKVIFSNSHSIYKGASYGNMIGKIQTSATDGLESVYLSNAELAYHSIIDVGVTVDLIQDEVYKVISDSFDGGVLASNNFIKWDTGDTLDYIPDATWEPVNALPYLNIGTIPRHSITTIADTTSASKSFMSIAEKDGVLYSQIMIEELVENLGLYDGSNGEFNNLTNGTSVDLNGKTVRNVVASTSLNVRK